MIVCRMLMCMKPMSGFVVRAVVQASAKSREAQARRRRRPPRRPEIPGVVSAGTPIERVLEGFNGLDDPIGLMAGRWHFRSRRAAGPQMDTASNQVSVLVGSPTSRTASARTAGPPDLGRRPGLGRRGFG